MNRLYPILFFLCIAVGAAAQKPLLLHFSGRDGLPGNTVYDVFQDRRGFIWLGTDQGVCMFDGHRFQSYTIKDGLPDNDVFTVREDDYGRCWLVCYNSQPCYLYNGNVYNAQNDQLCRAMVKADIGYKSFFRDKQGRSCLGGKRVCILYRDSISLPYPGLVFSGVTLDHFISDSNEYYLDSNIVYLVKGKECRSVYKLSWQLRMFASYYYDHHLLVSAGKGNRHFIMDIVLGDSVRCVAECSVPALCYDFYPGKKGELFLLTEAGLLVYNTTNHTCSNTGPVQGHFAFSRMIKDDEGNYWLATINDGVYVLPRTPVSVLNATPGPGQDAVCLAAAYAPGHILSAYTDGSFNITDGKKRSAYKLPAYRSQNRIVYACAVSARRLLVGSDAGLYTVDPETGACRMVFSGTQKAGMRCGDHFNFAAFYAAFRLDLQTGKITEIWHRRTTAIAEDKCGRTWLGTPGGLYCYKDGKTAHFTADPALSVARITSLALSGENLVIATHKDGLYIYGPGGLQHIDQATGISSSSCRKVVTDSAGTIWLCTDAGIDRLTYKGAGVVVYHYTRADGVMAKVNDISFFEGNIYAATTAGVLVLSGYKSAETTPPRVYITSVHTRDRMIAFPASAVYDYTGGGLQIHFTGISFVYGSDIEYRYVLEGADADTMYTKNASVNLDAIKAGSFRFVVWARSGKGPWSRSPAVFSFHVDPPFWLSVWFIVPAAIVAGLLGWLLYRRKIRLLKLAEEEKLDKQRQVAALEMQALRAQINPHFMFNALNSIQNFFSRKDERAVNYYITSFAGLIRKSLHYSGANWLQLSEEIHMLRLYIELEQMRFEGRFTSDIRVDDAIVPESLQIPAMLIQPYVENAINHGLRHLENGNGRLLLQFEAEGALLKCTIDDNGPGIDSSSTRPGHKSMGMEISRQRVAAINKLYRTNIELVIADKRSLAAGLTGTRIVIFIPKRYYETATHYNSRR